jgi:UDP-N-acetylmuramyl pentapeptide phosphotransferase/UDP-N-acetylglucosamine-1-phosphate transferase
MAILLSLFIATVYGKKMILFLQDKQIGESVRELGLAGEQQKKGTPTMGGIIILMSVLIPTLLFANLDKVYIRLMILCTVWLGLIGFLDDYRRINVAFSRVKRLLVVVGDSEYLIKRATLNQGGRFTEFKLQQIGEDLQEQGLVFNQLHEIF